MNIRLSGIEEHTSHIYKSADGVRVITRPVTSVTIEVKLESGGPEVMLELIDSRRLGAYMGDGNTYRMRYQSDGYMWISVTYRISPPSANPFGAATTAGLRAQAPAYIKRRLEAALARS